jgi:DNA repair exonuclease SbcCD nuclease subunit
MRVVLFADLHLDTPFAWAGREVARRRRQRLRDVLVRIAELAVDVHADALLCAGDLYEHDRVLPDTAEFVRRTFEDLHPLPVYLAPGNHDWFGPASLYACVTWPPNVHVFGADRLEPVTLAEGLTLWGAAHRAPANTDGFLRTFRVDRGGIHVALFHGSEQSRLPWQGAGKVAHAAFDAAELERAGLHHAFLGHYHQPVAAERYTYPGNPEPLSFGEDGERGAVVVTINPDGSVQRERRLVRLTEVHDVEVDVTGSTTWQDVRDRVASALAGLAGSARVTVVGEVGPEVDVDLGALDAPPGIEALVVRAPALAVAYDYEAIASEQSVRGEFVRDVRAAAELTEDERRRVLITGLRALTGRSDLKVP